MVLNHINRGMDFLHWHENQETKIVINMISNDSVIVQQWNTIVRTLKIVTIPLERRCT